ncbi:MAG TPA: peptidylprolyl isomerase [Nevskiaceae bacterium]|nr:peptidylprolyl isomerase [Nevskiaceae bacterium]
MKKKNWFLAVACAGLLVACGGDKLATVNGEAVTREEFQAYLKYKHLPVTDKEAARWQGALDQYLQRKGLAMAVEQAMKHSDVVDSALLQAEIDDFRREALVSRYFEQYLSKQVTDDAVTSYYNQHAQDYSERRVHIAHILFRTTRAMSENERRAQLTKAQEAASKIRAGTDFAKVAEQVSEDAISAKKGGDLGWVREGAIDPKLSQIAFELKEGTVSEPFETQFGFHIIKVLEAPQTKQRPLEAVKGDIRYRLRSEAKEAEVKRLTESVSIKKKG